MEQVQPAESGRHVPDGPDGEAVAVIAHVSDPHLDGQRRARRRAEAVMAYLDGLPFDLDAVVVTGDIADHARAEEYHQARRLFLGCRHPVLIGPGNHDRRPAFRQHLLGEPVEPAPVEPAPVERIPAGEAPIDQVLRAERFVLALCDSSVPGRDEGFLADRTLAWLAALLDQTPPEVPVLVAFHHPPVPLHLPYVDGIRQFDSDRLVPLVRRHPNLVAFLAGHAHTAAVTTFAGRPLLVAPGVVSAVRLPWEQLPERRSSTRPEDLVLLDQAPALAFHVLSGDGRLTTHYRWLPGWVPAAG